MPPCLFAAAFDFRYYYFPLMLMPPFCYAATIFDAMLYVVTPRR
jgi:hypothetical protein